MDSNLINQQGMSAGRVYGGNDTPKQDEKPVDKPLTRDEVRAMIAEIVQPFVNGLVETIKSGFATKADVNNSVNRISANINVLQSRIPIREEIINIAKEAVPTCLRNLDSGGSQRTGNVLMLAPSPVGTSGNSDSCFFGNIAIPAGIDWTKVFFGYKFDPNADGTGNLMRIMYGEVNRTAATQTDLTVSNNDFVYVKRYVSGGVKTATILNGQTVPDDDKTNNVYYYKLYQVSVNDADVAVVSTYCRPFGIEDGGLPDGDQDEQNLIWNNTLQTWQVGFILPQGDSVNIHLVWNVALLRWEAGLIIPHGGVYRQPIVCSNDTDANGDKVLIKDWLRWHQPA